MPRSWRRIRRTPSRPRERRELTEEERAIRATRVSPYQARIERRLTDIFFEVPGERQAGREWRLTHVAHTRGHAVCELCGHNPIRRLFFINSVSTGQELMIGSECARNYVGVDLVDAYIRNIGREQAHRRQSREQQERTERIQREAEERRTRIDQERRTWREHHGALRQFLRSPSLWADSNDRFLRSLAEWLESHGYLTVNQTRAARRNLRERMNLIGDDNATHTRIRALIGQDRVEEARESQDQESNPAVLVEGDITPGTIAAGTVASGRLVMDQHGITRVEEATTAPAQTESQLQMFNGLYEVRQSNAVVPNQGTPRYFSIYTVRVGPLAGRRIIKHGEDPMGMRGFAFLTADGTLALWRRFQNREEHPWINEAEDLLFLLRGRIPFQRFSGIIPASGLRYTVLPLLNCIRCNSRLPLAHGVTADVLANMCRGCIGAIPNTMPRNLTDFGLVDDHPVPTRQAEAIHRMRSDRDQAEALQRAVRGVNTAGLRTAHPTTPPAEPTTSELGTGWLQ